MLKPALSGNPSVYVALLHHSMHDKHGRVVTTAVTNLDIHDISRTARTYGLCGYYLVNPLEEQQAVVNRIIGHWLGEGGRKYNPDRSEAFSLVKVVSWLQEAVEDIQRKEEQAPLVLMTTARELSGLRGYTSAELRKDWEQGTLTKPVLLCFGTGWGMAEELLRKADGILEPILPARDSGYNHLSVRSAVAIFLDRLLGARVGSEKE